MKTEFDLFVKKQVEEQKKNRLGSGERPLDFSPFEKALSAFDPLSVEGLIRGRTVEELQEAVSAARLTYEAICLYFLWRIREEKNAHCSLIRLAPDALKRARAADADKSAPRRGIAGLPVLVKDNVGTGPLLATSGGSHLLSDLQVRKSPLVETLEKAGAYVLGKTNLSEFAFYMSTEGVCGYSSRGGQTRHPLGDYEVGGSSSGTAVALALGLAPLGIGSETNGSIIYPAGQNGVVGFYPARGSWPTEGILPITHRLDTPGPMARTVEDARALAEAVTGAFDRIDQVEEGAVVLFDPPTKKWGRGDDAGHLERAAALFRERTVPVVSHPFPEEAYALDLSPLMAADLKKDLDAFFDQWVEDEKRWTLKELVEAYKKGGEDHAPYGFDLLEEALTPPLSQTATQELAEDLGEAASTLLEQVFEKGKVVLGINSQLSNLYAACGYPTLVVPFGTREEGEPLGLAMTARPGDEAWLFTLGRMIEGRE